MSGGHKAGARQYGPWYSEIYGAIYSNRAHYNDCVQFHVHDNANNSYWYAPYRCGYSPVISRTPNVNETSQGLAWREGGTGCGFIWAREEGHKLNNSRHVYSAC